MNTLNEIDSAHTLCFSGHRPKRLPGKGELNAPETKKLTAILRQELVAAVERGKTIIVHGCMCGFDILASEQVLALKE